MKSTLKKTNKAVDCQVEVVYVTDTMNGEELRQARDKLKLTQKQLGEALELHKNSVARMERGELPVAKTTELAVRFLLLVSKTKRGKK